MFHPGTKFEYMLILVGGQGAGKSTFFRFLAMNDSWFTDDLKKLDDENVFRKMQGHLIIELSEMIATASARSIEDIKSFISRQSDIYKVPYETQPKDRPSEIQEAFPGIKGFNRRGLYRMKQFYETYKDNEIVTPLVTQISWTNHLLIMSGCKTDEEREFYIRLCIKENYSKRQLERQLDSGYYERYMLSKETLLPESVKKLGENPFLDSYVMEFLDLPNEFHENDLRKALIRNMKDFILELGKDFTFIDEEYKVQVGGDDFRIDLLFYHRGLQCLVAIELKIGKFKPEYISKLDFYLEALDRQVKKENENPSVGLLLCAAKNDEVVEYAMSRTMSPMLVSQYQLQLPDKAVLEKKLQQLVNIPQIED